MEEIGCNMVETLVPHMPKDALSAFRQHLLGSKALLEYGAGGSTAYAASMGINNIISTDSSKVWLESVRSAIQNSGSTVNLHLIHSDIGEIIEWGRPKDRSHIASFHQYPIRAWNLARSLDLKPDLVLIDGRFRVACFCASLIFASEETIILFDDYVERPHYHVVESVCKIISKHDRMAEFKCPADLDYAAITKIMFDHIHDVE